MRRGRQHREPAGPGLALAVAKMSGHVLESKAYPLAWESVCKVNAQLLALGRDLRHARSDLVEINARCLENVARPKLLVCHVG